MPDFYSMPVLIVDDYNTMIRIIRNLLKQIGFDDIDDAGNGHTALEKMGMRKYGLVLCDTNMEGMTGIDVLKVMRRDPFNRDVPVIMITSEQMVGDVRAAKPNSWIVKPFNAHTLKRQIDGVFEALAADEAKKVSDDR